MEESTPFSPLNVYVGYDVREHEAFEVCRWSLARRSSVPVTVRALDLVDLVKDELYWRGWREDDKGRKVDLVDGKNFSTDFSFSRFLVPELARRRHLTGYVVFCDCDFLWLRDIAELLPRIDPSKAISVVQHRYEPTVAEKMDGQVQEAYRRKLWSSLMVFNLAHPALERLSPGYVNTAFGSDLHQFNWLADEDLGAIDPIWNHIPGHSPMPSVTDQIYAGRKLGAVHYTLGGPWFEGFENCDFSGEWLAERAHWRAFQAGR
jgi:lipopolysaccharide biosynthesis glycosyltransferase